MHNAAQAYGKVAQQTLTGRDLEAHVLIKAATKLQRIVDDWDARQGELTEALTNNRKLWTILVAAVTEADNPLPQPIKSNIASLGLFVFNHTISVMITPAPERLKVLININRDLAAGLRGMAAQPAATTA
jgi:flagellar protein FlaF